MKLLVVLSVVSCCLAMPTPTNNATETLFRMMEKMKERLFSAQCVAENPTNDAAITVWTQPMQCAWPNMHNMSACVDQWVTMMGNTGCTVPSEGMVKMLKRAMAHRNYENSPIISKFPKKECGMCGRRIQCCPASPFLVQSYQSTVCESAPCQVEPMTMENWNYMREKYPEWNLPTTNEPCNFAAIMRESMMHSKVFPFMRTMYMQMVGAEMPTMNCHMVENMCSCCCSGFVSQAGICVPMTEGTTMTPGVTTPITTMMPETVTTITTMMPETTTTMIMTETMVEVTTPTTMPVVVTTMEQTTVQTTTVQPVHVTTTPKTLFNMDQQMENNRKRRSAEKEDSDEMESSEEKEEVVVTKVVAEKVTEETVSSEGEDEAKVVVAEVVAAEIVETKENCPITEAMTTPLPTEIITTEAMPEGTTMELTEAMTEGTTMKLIEATTMKAIEATTIKLTEVWTEGTTIKPINATIPKLAPLETKEMTEAPIALPKVETPILKDDEKPKPAIKE